VLQCSAVFSVCCFMLREKRMCGNPSQIPFFCRNLCSVLQCSAVFSVCCFMSPDLCCENICCKSVEEIYKEIYIYEKRPAKETHTSIEVKSFLDSHTCALCCENIGANLSNRSLFICRDLFDRFMYELRPTPPAPMNHVNYLRAGPAEMPFRNWYTANTNHFHLTDSVRWK